MIDNNTLVNEKQFSEVYLFTNSYTAPSSNFPGARKKAGRSSFYLSIRTNFILGIIKVTATRASKDVSNKNNNSKLVENLK